MMLTARYKGPRGIVSIGATYFFFLIFAQFAFLEMVQAQLAGYVLETAMIAMGLAGLSASLTSALALRQVAHERLLRWGFLACALSAATAPLARGPGQVIALAALIGAALGCLTVTLAASLNRLLPMPAFGLRVGLGTGLAYWTCNLPLVFEAAPARQALLAAIACLAGFAVNRQPFDFPHETARQTSRAEDQSSGTESRRLQGIGLTRLGFSLILLSFLALIWMDSSAFFIIQQNRELKAASWGHLQLWINGAIHLVFALLAGVAVDRGRFREVLPVAFLGLGAGSLCLILGGRLTPFSGPFYVAGVSLYSVALVAYPTLCPENGSALTRAWRAALIYGIAGWLGSALGIGMARDLHRIPLLFLGLAGLVVCGVWCFSRIASKPRRLMATAVLTVLMTAACGPSVPQADWAGPASATRGRNVYLAEGCIHCHSQYVRPIGEDETRWGPSQSLAVLKQQRPPLFGNRRQGPDLLNVGNRRGAEWQRLHLKDPRLISPGSRMPAYEFLFKDRRGEDLIAYLESLGAATIVQRVELARAWQPSGKPFEIDLAAAALRFGQTCAPCHGDQGLGNGPAAAHLALPVRDLVHDPFRFIHEEDSSIEIGLARVIKFGLPGTSMPGHEYLTDKEILQLVAYTRYLRKPRIAAPTSAALSP